MDVDGAGDVDAPGAGVGDGVGLGDGDADAVECGFGEAVIANDEQGTGVAK